MSNRLIVKTLKPRNPLVVPSLARKAGAHMPNGGSQRQRSRLELRQALRHELPQHLPHSP
jgi:hypothetical protein